MNTEELKEEIVYMAINWFEGRRPLDYSYCDHWDNPMVNCANDLEKDLARAVAAFEENKYAV